MGVGVVRVGMLLGVLVVVMKRTLVNQVVLVLAPCSWTWMSLACYLPGNRLSFAASLRRRVIFGYLPAHPLTAVPLVLPVQERYPAAPRLWADLFEKSLAATQRPRRSPKPSKQCSEPALEPLACRGGGG